MTETPNPDEQNLALAALLLDRPEAAAGNKPTTVELWDWMHSSLSPQRASEVESHVARDPDVFEQWRQLRLSESDIQSDAVGLDTGTPVSGTAGWWQRIRDTFTDSDLYPVRGLAVGLAMVMVFVTAGLLQQVPDSLDDVGTEFWAGWQSPKQSSVNNLDLAQQSHLRLILAGVSKHLQNRQLSITGPDGEALPVTDCTGGAECDNTSTVLFQLGQRAAAARTLCIGGQSLATDDTLPATLSALETSQAALLVHKPLRSWVEASSSVGRCSAVDTLISRALTGFVK